MIRLIALDLDGTLLDPAGRITQASKDAIARARAAGVRVVLNTGRPIQEAVWFAGEAGCDALLSCLGGAAVVDGVRGETLRRWDMPEESGRRALELCLGREIELMIFAGEEIVVDPFSKESLSRTYPFPIFHSAAVVAEDPLRSYNVNGSTAVVAEDPRAYLEERGLPLTKVHGDWNQARYPLEELGALPGVQLTASNDHDFELVPDRVDKGRAMALIALLYGVPLGETAAVGDSDNDLSMLRAAGLPIAMGNAPAAVREAAQRTAPSNQEEGVAWAISRCLEENEWERGEKG